jgi:hypothetical protein
VTLVLINEDLASTIVTRVPQGEARREHPLRDLLHDNPMIAPVHDLDPSYGQLFAVAKELNVPGVGFIDVVLADEWGRLVIIECKLWRNPQARREVVGQILDYARELSRWGYEDLQRQISISTRRQGNVLYDLACGVGCQLSEAQFVDRVSRDLTAGRFLLLIAGDGITEGTRRIGEYLRDQPGLAFDFGLIEIAEYRFTDGSGAEQVIVQPRVLAQTAVLERHVIRSEVTGIAIDPVATTESGRVRMTSSGASEAGQAWRAFVERFVAETRFDDPGQPQPRSGGNGWIRMQLPGQFYINAYRSLGEGKIGAQVRFPGAEGAAAYALLAEERGAIDREFIGHDLPAPTWNNGDVPVITLTEPSPAPWDDTAEAAQRLWMGRAANQLVNSLRPGAVSLMRTALPTMELGL